MSELVRTHRDADVLVVEIDNPPVNALGPGVPEALAAVLDAADRGDPVVAIRRIEHRGQGLGHTGPERVDRRVVDLDDEHVAVTFGAYELGHGSGHRVREAALDQANGKPT